MAYLTPQQADLLVILFTIFWGIIIETRFVSRWTILFNVVPLVTLLSSVDMQPDLMYFLVGYAMGSIGLAFIPKQQNLKQLVGAKGYGSLSLSIWIFKPTNLTVEVIIIWIIFAVIVYVLWWKIRKRIRKS